MKHVRAFTIYRDGFMLLVMGYTGKKALGMKLAYIEAFNRMEAELAARSRPLADDMVLPAPLPPADRSELKTLVDAQLSSYPVAVQGKARAEIWTRFNRHFRIAEYAQLPAAKMPEARDYLIQMTVKALQPAAASLPAEPGQPAAGAHMACLLLIEDVRERLRTTCHPGPVTMKMTPQERRVYYACHAAYVAADEALAGAYSILDAGRRMAEAARM